MFCNCISMPMQSLNRKFVLQILHKTFQQIAVELSTQQISPIQGLLYPFTSTATALRQFSQAQHIGKIVACIPSPAGVSSGAAESAGLWMVTGGLGSLGNITAQWLTDQGCRHICLIGRTGRYGSRINKTCLTRTCSSKYLTVLQNSIYCVSHCVVYTVN